MSKILEEYVNRNFPLNEKYSVKNSDGSKGYVNLVTFSEESGLHSVGFLVDLHICVGSDRWKKAFKCDIIQEPITKEEIKTKYNLSILAPIDRLVKYIAYIRPDISVKPSNNIRVMMPYEITLRNFINVMENFSSSQWLEFRTLMDLNYEDIPEYMPLGIDNIEPGKFYLVEFFNERRRSSLMVIGGTDYDVGVKRLRATKYTIWRLFSKKDENTCIGFDLDSVNLEIEFIYIAKVTPLKDLSPQKIVDGLTAQTTLEPNKYIVLGDDQNLESIAEVKYLSMIYNGDKINVAAALGPDDQIYFQVTKNINEKEEAM